MGVVYQAWQSRPRRLVALKVGRTRYELARQHSEPEIVARLQHPNIVPVYEVGENRGLPYFSMEFLEGGSLAYKLASSPLDPKVAAELVQTLARAVQFAHEQGVVHRDLKPSNVLLTRDGVPKVSDFGLAKQFASDLGSAPPEYRTQTGAILGTPSYMAPEQAGGRAEDIGPGVDVYALGAILYECLTGRPPFKAANVLETLDQVRIQEPVPPIRLQPRLPRDLQTICLKCLQKDAQKRYRTAQDLADDLGRFLRGEPIRARPVSPIERLVKWTRRRPALAALLVLIALSLVSLVAGVLLYNASLQVSEAKARQQQERADAGYRAARDTLNRMLGRLEQRPVGQFPQLKELQRDLMEDALTFYEGALADAENLDPAVRRDTAEALHKAATIQHRLGRTDAATANYRRAITLIEGLPPEQRDAAASQALVAGCHGNLGMMAADVRRWDEAERHHRLCVGIRERLVEVQPDDRAAQAGLAESAHNLGVMFLLAGKPAEALPHHLRAITIRIALVHDYPQDEAYQAALAGTYVNLGSIYMQTERPSEAEQAYVKAEALLRPLVARHPFGGENALVLAALYASWGYLLRGTDRPEAAVDRATEAIALAEALLAQEPNHAAARMKAYQAHGARAQFLETLNRYAEAVKDWDRVIELGPPSNLWVNRLHRTYDLARAGEHGRAFSEVEALGGLPEATVEGRFHLARILALAVAPAQSDTRLSSAERNALAERYASAAVALLRKAHEQGYFKERQHSDQLRTDADLRVFHDRDDFRKLLREIAEGD
jgi:serine/threonine-protein kinase